MLIIYSNLDPLVNLLCLRVFAILDKNKEKEDKVCISTEFAGALKTVMLLKVLNQYQCEAAGYLKM